jgi:hypothetical protein
MENTGTLDKLATSLPARADPGSATKEGKPLKWLKDLFTGKQAKEQHDVGDDLYGIPLVQTIDLKLMGGNSTHSSAAARAMAPTATRVRSPSPPPNDPTLAEIYSRDHDAVFRLPRPMVIDSSVSSLAFDQRILVAKTLSQECTANLPAQCNVKTVFDPECPPERIGAIVRTALSLEDFDPVAVNEVGMAFFAVLDSVPGGNYQ